MNKVFVTGIGILTSLGCGKEVFWNSLYEKKSGIGEVTLYNTEDYYLHEAGECKFITEKTNRADIFIRKVLEQALEDALLDSHILGLKRTKIYIGTAHGELLQWQDYVNGDISKTGFPIYTLGKNVFDMKGIYSPVEYYSTACTSSTIAMGMAMFAIMNNEIDIALVFGVDILNEFVHAGFTSLRALTSAKCRPFDSERDGLVLGEGCGCIILESSNSVSQRKIGKVYAEFLGFGSCCDAVHLTSPDKHASGVINSLYMAMHQAHIDHNDISYINLHGTGTPYNDRMECVAIKSVFKQKAASIVLSSIKSSIGHTMGASGVIEAILLCLSLCHQAVVPILNHTTPIKGFPYNFVKQGVKTPLTIAASLNSAFGGNNACILFKKESRT